MVRYKIEIAPKNASGYDSYIDVTDRIEARGVSTITKSIDSLDYTFGIYTFSDITLNANNKNGYFNINDSRSIFKYKRDLSKVRVTFVNFDEDPLSEETTQVVYNGIINDEATRLDVQNSMITFKVLSFDSVFRTLQVSSGIIGNNENASTAILNILNITEITSVLNVSESNINVGTDIVLDSGTSFTNKTVQLAINELLLITNSCLIIDSDSNIIVKSRAPETFANALDLYGPGDIHKRENIISLMNYNDGIHRTFTSVSVNNRISTNSGYAADFGFRQKQITINSINTDSKSESIAAALVDEFKAPKIELEVSCKTNLVLNYDLLDSVRINYPFRVETDEDKFFPIVGAATIGDSLTPLPKLFGSIAISDSIAFKIIEIEHDVKKFVTKLKVRQSGNSTGDGFFYESPIVGYAKVEVSVLAEDAADYNLDWVPSSVGAAIINGVSST